MMIRLRNLLLPCAVVLGACTTSELPSQQIAGSYQQEVAALRAHLQTVCTAQETEIILEGLAILADASQPENLSGSQKAGIERRNAEFEPKMETVSPQCRERLNELAGPDPFGA